MARPPSDTTLLLRWARVGWAGEGRALAWLLVGSALVGLGHAGFTAGWKLVLDAAVTGGAGPAGAALLAFALVQALLYVTVQGTRTRVNGRIQVTARQAVFDHVSRTRPGALRPWRLGDLVARLTDDVSDDKLAWFLCSGVFRAYEAGCVVVACVAVMAWLDPWLTVWTLLPLPLFVGSHMALSGRFGRVATAAQTALSHTATITQDAFDGVRVLRAHGLGPLARRAFSDAARTQADAEVSRARIEHGLNLELAWGWQLGTVALLVAGGQRLVHGTLDLSTFVAFTGFGMTLVFQMFDFAAFAVRSRVAAASLRRLDELLAADVGPEHCEGTPTLSTSDTVTIPARFTTPHLAFDLGAPLTLHPGEILAVTGPVGSGKSTFIRALAGEEPTEPPLPARPPAAWVPQDAVVLSVPVRANVTLGRDAAVEDAVAAAQLGADLARWRDGLETPVGDRGVTLSGGQQQRVQLARALVGGEPLLLLDDPTSALDADTEARFWDDLDLAGRFVVVATHRPATLARADVVLYLRDGRVAGRGTHAELVATVPAYAAAYG